MSIQQKQLNIGLFGFGVVGSGLYKVLQQTPSLNAQINKVCIKHPEKKREAPGDLFTTNAELLLQDENINVIVELIDDAEAAYHIVTTALKAGKAVVSANKKLIAEHLPELLALQEKHNTPFLYEAACCASIPVVRNLEEYYDNDLLAGVTGIVNGSTNYILTRIAEDKLDFQQALLQAQIEGFAESDPTLDIEGIDAVNKLSILLAHAYGTIEHPSAIIHSGITQLQEHDAIFAKEKGYKIKLVAQARKQPNGDIAAFVLPQFVDQGCQLYGVGNEYNGVVIESGFADKQFFYGKGAGSFPTASAVLSDVSALRYDYRYEYKKLRTQKVKLTTDFYLRVYVSFEGLFHVPHERFERIEEWSSNDKRCSVVGIIHFSQLLDKGWWKKKNASLILLPDAFVDRLPEKVTKKEDEAVFA
ncbi:homoserine dehydrogenase [Polluticoccus soli]|uniref:homoserine dehydrogenase n=1 Tax=Polluticoccus soli TaxID=3034150 RepID=UPI0023E2E631|nr:homoserine dehydrogenase [Flavipsychrobacter sp. JY13-12]